MSHLVRTLPMLPLIAMMKNIVEEGRELPKEVQLIDSVGTGMVVGMGYSFPLSGVDLVKAAKAQFPTYTPHEAVKHFVQRRGVQQMGRVFPDSCVRNFSRGAWLGGGYFVVDQGYKAYKKYTGRKELA